MSHPRWPGYNDKTGNPTLDNFLRNNNRWMWKSAQGVQFKGAKSRKRKKLLTRVEGGNYVRLLHAVASDIQRKQA
jgi:hypothetical protein